MNLSNAEQRFGIYEPYFCPCFLSSRNGSAKIVSNVIIDKEEEDDDDQFVVEAALHLPEITEMAMVC